MKKILVVEDDPDQREGLIMILELDGYATIQAEDGVQGLELARNEAPDLVITGNWMPRMNGDEMIARLLDHPETSAIPILFMVQAVHRERAEEMCRRGIRGYFLKPFDADELLRRVKGVWESAR